MAIRVGDTLLYYATAADVTNNTPQRVLITALNSDPPTEASGRALRVHPDDDGVFGSLVPPGIDPEDPIPITLSRVPVAGQGVAQVGVQTASTPAIFAAQISGGLHAIDPSGAIYVVGNDAQRPGIIYAPDITGGEIRPTTDHWRQHLYGEAFSASFAGGETRVLGSATLGPGISINAPLGDVTYNAGVISWTTWQAVLDVDVSGSFETNVQNTPWFVRVVQNPAFPIEDKRQQAIGHSLDITNKPDQVSGFARNIPVTFPNQYTIEFTNGAVGNRTLDVEAIQVDFVLRLG